MTFKFTYTILVTTLLFGTAGCNFYPDSDARTEDLDMTITHYDVDYDFSQVNTYSIVDDVYEVDGDEDDDPNIIEGSEFILNIINTNMQALGYEKVDVADNPDVRMTVLASSTTFTTIYYDYWCYYYYYWWGYCPGGGWYYPSYPVYVDQYTTGTVFIDMVDFDDQPGEDDDVLVGVWTAVLNGLLAESTSSNQTRVKDGIDQAFAQSPYLQK